MPCRSTGVKERACICKEGMVLLSFWAGNGFESTYKMLSKCKVPKMHCNRLAVL